MIQKQLINGFETYTISSTDGSTQASFIPERGGILYSVVMPGQQGARELLFQDEQFWSRSQNSFMGGAPFCFPICGRLERQSHLNAYYYDGRIYELPIHGFAASKPWEVAKAGENHLALTLRDDEETRTVYPFHFTVELHYEVSAKRLFCRQTYTNHGEIPLPYYAGFHPYFLTPSPGQGKEHVILNYTPIRRFRYNQRLTDLVGEQPLFILPTAVSNAEINEQLTQLGEDKQIHLHYPGGDVINLFVEGVEDPDLFSYVQIYTEVDKSFICVEPWMAYPNALNSVAGARWLAPGQSEHGTLRLWVE